MWSDNIAERDYLGFDVHANLIKGIIDEPKMLPITIGVFGDWGSGKSSIMQSLKRAYDEENDEHTLCLQFNGWVFEGYDDAKAALIEAILKGFCENKTITQKVKDRAKKLFKSVNWMRVIGFGVKNLATPLVTASLTGGASLGWKLLRDILEEKTTADKIQETIKGLDYDDLKKRFLKEDVVDLEEQYQLVRKFRDDFSNLLQEGKVEKLIVLIDDLDRCLPDRIIDNLEAIKLFLNVEKTAFVIGADPRIVRDAIRYRYKDLITREESSDENKRVVTDYLEKLIQIPYSLPKLSDTEVETYITLLFCEDSIVEKADMDVVLREFKKFRKSDRYSVFGMEQIKKVITEGKVRKRLETNVSLISKLSPLIAGNLDGNPRQIKRFLNTFVLRKKLADAAKLDDFKEDILAKLMILEYAEPKKFTTLYGWQMQNKGYAQELRELETHEGKARHKIGEKLKDWNTPKILTWLNSEPMLANVDLRDYFWLSRDSLRAMSDVMTPPVVKTIMNALLIKNQGTLLIRKKIKEEVLQLPENLQQELYGQLVRKANNTEIKHIFNLFEYFIDEGCACENEFRELCDNFGKKPAVKEIVNRIATNHQEYQDLKRS